MKTDVYDIRKTDAGYEVYNQTDNAVAVVCADKKDAEHKARYYNLQAMVAEMYRQRGK